MRWRPFLEDGGKAAWGRCDQGDWSSEGIGMREKESYRHPKESYQFQCCQCQFVDVLHFWFFATDSWVLIQIFERDGGFPSGHTSFPWTGVQESGRTDSSCTWSGVVWETSWSSNSSRKLPIILRGIYEEKSSTFMWPVVLWNTRILTDYAQKSPRRLQVFINFAW